jgi:hypothetical protein
MTLVSNDGLLDIASLLLMWLLLPLLVLLLWLAGGCAS